MTASVSDLIQLAKREERPAKAEKARYAYLAPVATELMERGFNLAESVDWLIAQGQIKKANRSNAYHSLSNHFRRKANNQKTN